MTARKLAILVFGVIVLASIGWMIYRDSPIRGCLALLPTDTKAGVSATSKGADSAVDITAATKSLGAQNQMQSSGFLECIRIVKGVEVVDRNQSAIQPSTLGQIADQWDRDNDAFRIFLASKEVVLQNFEIGPDQGHKALVISRWCEANKTCVVCSPDPRDTNSTSTKISLRPSARTTREPMASASPWKAPPVPVPYMDIVDGVRFNYRCEP